MAVVITFLASFLIWFLYLGLAIWGGLSGKKKTSLVVHALLASFLAWGIAEMIKSLFPSTRPFISNHAPIFTLTFPSDNAFPSGHAAAVFGLAVAVWVRNRKAGYVFLLGAMLVGIGRVLANVHYVLDISIGSLIGIITALVTKKMRLPLDY